MQKMNKKRVIKAVEDFAKGSTIEFDSGHDWWHLHRVRNLSLYLQKEEHSGDPFIIEISALLHDIDDKKFRKSGSPGAETIIADLLGRSGVNENMISEVVRINKGISFSAAEQFENKSAEFAIVQDADRLDAIGAIGIARAFNYGGFRNNAIYVPEMKGKTPAPSTIRHFFDKLLLLSGIMNTPAARKLAKGRHQFMESYLEQFYSEWNTSY
jgi:uncharacterized protein